MLCGCRPCSSSGNAAPADSRLAQSASDPCRPELDRLQRNRRFRRDDAAVGAISVDRPCQEIVTADVTDFLKDARVDIPEVHDRHCGRALRPRTADQPGGVATIRTGIRYSAWRAPHVQCRDGAFAGHGIAKSARRLHSRSYGKFRWPLGKPRNGGRRSGCRNSAACKATA